MPFAFSGISACVLDDLIYIVGAHEDILRFDPLSETYHACARTSIDRTYCASFVLGGCLYVAGGSALSSSSVEGYDATTDTWTSVANKFMLERRKYCEAVTITIGSVGPTEE
jgi:hypothetical protein